MPRLLLPLGLMLLWASPLWAQMVVDMRMHCTADGTICVPKAPLKDSGIRYHKVPPKAEPVATPALAPVPPPLAAPVQAKLQPPPKAPLPVTRQVSPPAPPPGPPRVGQIAQNLRGFEQAQRSRFAPPPAGQAYWVVADYLVLLRQSDRQIMAVLGPVDALIK